MIRNYFVLDGKSSTDFNTYIAKSHAFDGVVPDIESLTVPGRDGELTYSNKRYSVFEDEIEAYIPRQMLETIDGLRAWLTSKTGYVRYEEAIHPDEYRLARFSGALTISESDHKGAAFTLPFTFQPQRWLKTGENTIEFTANGSLFNPTLFAAKPLIRAYGTGSMTVNGYTVTVNSASGYTDIDCEIMDCYKGSTNCNGNVTLINFPVLSPGNNTITFTGFTSIEIKPRWYTI